MQSLDLVDRKDCIDPGVEKLKPRELFYLRLPSWNKLSKEVSDLISKATKHSSEVILSIPGEEYSDHERRDYFFSLGIKGFSLRLSHNPTKWLKHDGIGHFNSGDRDLVQLYRDYKSSLPEEKELMVEFQVGDDIRVLAPTIAGVYNEGARSVVLNVPGSPQSHKVSQMRDVFEYLKIRSCNYLNVYFPFWNSHFREWDIKTQNTFSGLQFVHIDISNRCTHSCVFCGLYSPDSIEEQKKKAGGSLPEAISSHMKKEIDADKCLGIIRSLPWSVDSIQFGGFGDPLMHEDSVRFIAAARERGFRVEVLSNMEYLDDEDIELLHKLGGATLMDLHFFANISGGNSEIYLKTRPKQTDKAFAKIVKNLKKFSELRKNNNGDGVTFTVMCVVNTVNCQYLLEVAQLAHEVQASRIWFKPMELHSSSLAPYAPAKTQMKSFAKSLKSAVKFADEKKIEVFQRDYCEALINQYSGDTVDV